MDRYGRTWDVSADERCRVCGQPDNCGDCTHDRLSDEEVKTLGGHLSPTFRNRSRAYVKAITFIAMNDETGSGQGVEEISTLITVALVSEVWKLSERTVATEVAWVRERNGLEVAR